MKKQCKKVIKKTSKSIKNKCKKLTKKKKNNEETELKQFHNDHAIEMKGYEEEEEEELTEEMIENFEPIMTRSKTKALIKKLKALENVDDPTDNKVDNVQEEANIIDNVQEDSNIQVHCTAGYMEDDYF